MPISPECKKVISIGLEAQKQVHPLLPCLLPNVLGLAITSHYIQRSTDKVPKQAA